MIDSTSALYGVLLNLFAADSALKNLFGNGELFGDTSVDADARVANMFFK